MWLFSIETLVLLISLLLLAKLYLRHKWSLLKKLNVPHNPPSIFMLGTFGGRIFKKDPHFKYANIAKQKFGSIWGDYDLLNPSIVVCDLEVIREIYIKEFQNFPDRIKILTKLNGEYMNEGLTVVKGNKWKRIRSTLTPTFSSGKLKMMFNIMQKCTDDTVLTLNKACDEKQGDFVARIVFSNLSLDVIMSTAMGVDCNIQTTDSKMSKEVRNAFKGGVVSSVVLVCILFPQTEWIFEKLGIGLFPNSALKYMTGVINSIIAERKKSGENYTDLLQLMLNAEVSNKEINDDSTSGISRKELIGNALLMVGAGFENTANSMSFLAYNFAFHPEIQEECQKEIDEAFESSGKFDYETVKNLKFLDMCVNESLRLYTPLIENSRVAQKETIIKGWKFPKNMTVRIPIFGLCHDPEYWKDPWEFKPERMADMSKIDPMVYQPFGAGPRNCIGLRFALMEIKIALCKILHNFTLKPSENTPKPPLELSLGFGVRSAIEFSLKAVPRRK